MEISLIIPRKWTVDIGNKRAVILLRSLTKKKDNQTVRKCQVEYDEKTYSYIIKTVFKERKNKTNNFNIVCETDNPIPTPELFFLKQELGIRSSFDISGLCELYAIRDSTKHTFLCNYFFFLILDS